MINILTNKYMKRLIYFSIFVLINFGLFSCVDSFEDKDFLKVTKEAPKYQEEIVINTNNIYSDVSILNAPNIATRSVIVRDSVWPDDFGKSLFGESSECVVLSGDENNIFPGALYQAKAIASGIYKPIYADIKPINVSISVPVINPAGIITKPSVGETRTFVNSKLNQSGVGEQITNLFYQTSQFTAYDELKMAFGTNTKINSIFFSKTSSTSEKIHKISKRTGIYCKFVQKNFTLDMDIPNGGRLINGQLSSSQTGGYDPLYIKSVAYGQMGLLTIESDYTYEEANKYVQEAFNVVFLKKTSTLSNEAKSMLNSAEMSVYLVGPGSGSVAQVVDGYEGFLQYIKSSGKFSKTNFGVPIYCTYAYLSDNSPAKVNFKIDVSTDPLYARVEYRNQRSSRSQRSTYSDILYADIYLAFYLDKQAIRKTNPPKYVTFYLNKYTEQQNDEDWVYAPVIKTTFATFTKNNTYNDSQILLESKGIIFDFRHKYSESDDRIGTGYGKAILTILQNGAYYKTLPPLDPPTYTWYKPGPWNQQ